jgi:cation diffusion facilitator CzcD-associated flavoprotein CzcO
VYSYSFAQQTDWSRRFAPGPEIRRYLETCVDEAGFTDRVILGMGIASAIWSGDRWQLELSDGARVEATVLICATGQLDIPAIPDIAGLDTFSGQVFHTARWRHDVDLTGKRVAVIGTGASAVQVIPAIVGEVGHLAVFQRSAPFVFPKPDGPYGPGISTVYRRHPLLRRAARRLMWLYLELFGMFFWRWPRMLSSLELIHRIMLRRNIDDPELRKALTPDHRIGCKRILIADNYHDSLQRPNVTVCTDPILEVHADGIETAGGNHPVDVMVFATGFATSGFAGSLSIIGRDGLSLQEKWADAPEAYLGLSVPDFPNLFFMYGPNTNLGSGSVIYLMEAQADHVVAAIERLRRREVDVLEVSRDVFEDFMSEVRATQPSTVWASGCASWYKQADGLDTHNWPWSMYRYRRMTGRVGPDIYPG